MEAVMKFSTLEAKRNEIIEEITVGSTVHLFNSLLVSISIRYKSRKDLYSRFSHARQVSPISVHPVGKSHCLIKRVSHELDPKITASTRALQFSPDKMRLMFCIRSSGASPGGVMMTGGRQKNIPLTIVAHAIFLNTSDKYYL